MEYQEMDLHDTYSISFFEASYHAIHDSVIGTPLLCLYDNKAPIHTKLDPYS